MRGAPAPPKPAAVYLDGCAWGCGFYVGVQEAFEELWGADFAQDMVPAAAGSGGGAVPSAGVALGPGRSRARIGVCPDSGLSCAVWSRQRWWVGQ